MGANIIITEVDEPKTLTDLDELKTPKVGGGYEYWVRKSDTKLTTKSISKNGTYNASSDDAYGYSKVTVNVRGGNGSADSHGKPSGGDIKPGGAGSAVVGEDEDGNEAVVGVDEQGKLVKTPIPSAIKIITPPTRTSYTAGESMDYTGIVVGLRNKDGSTFTDATYPNGHIPMGELVFPVEVAPETSGDADEWTDGDGVNAIKISYVLNVRGKVFIYPHPLGTFHDGSPCTVGGAEGTTLLLTRYNNNIYTTRISGPLEALGLYAYRNGTWDSVGGTSHTPSYGNFAPGPWGEYLINVPTSTVDPTTVSPSSLRPANIKIPVQWKSPYDGRELEDEFEITVTGAPSGSGGGGTF